VNEKQVQTRGCSAFQGNHKSDTSPKTFVRSKSFVLTQSSLAAKFEKKKWIGESEVWTVQKVFRDKRKLSLTNDFWWSF